MAGNSGSMFGMTARRGMRCAIYTRKSTEDGWVALPIATTMAATPAPTWSAQR